VKRLVQTLSAISAAVLLALAASSPSVALEDGDVIRIIVPYSAGGGFDAQARLAAPYIEAALQENGYPNSNVVVENLTGGGGAIANMFVYSAEPDGTTLLMMDPESSIWLQTVGGAEFDVGEYGIIAQQSAEAMGVFVNSQLGFDSMDKLVERAQSEPLLMGTSGRGAVDHIAPLILQKMLSDAGVEFPVQYVHMSGVSDVMASMRRGEVEVMYATLSSTVAAIKQGVGDYLFTFEDHGPLADRWPHGRDVLKLPPEQVERLTAASYFRRVYTTPPGVDEELLQTLRDIFEIALNNEELIKKSADSNRPVMFLNGADAEAAIDQEIGLAKEYEEYLREQLQ
jgi:tripartite-type tricarboxylate transporter receptor subunit TctC